ncbi:MAG: HAD family hydrolase, partial [Pseudomonadota bacterium]
MPTPPLRAILLDKDGTLTDFRATWEDWLADTLTDLAAETGVAVDALGVALEYDVAARRFRPGSFFMTATSDRTATALAAVTGWSDLRIGDWVSVRASRVVQIEVTPVGPLLDGLRGRGLR